MPRLLGLDGVGAAATAVRTTAAGNRILVGYVAMRAGRELDRAAAIAALRTSLPAPLVPLLAPVDDIPTRTSGKVDRDALPWPLASVPSAGDAPPADLSGTAAWVAGLWARVLGTAAGGRDADFFADGGGSLAAAQLVSALRERFPQVTVADVYEYPQLGQLADRLDELVPLDASTGPTRSVTPLPARAQLVQQLVAVTLAFVIGARWLVWVSGTVDVLHAVGGPDWLPHVSWWWIALGWLLLIAPPGGSA